MKKIIKSWAIPFFLAILSFWFGKPVAAQIANPQTPLQQYLNQNDVQVGVETVNGYQQVYYLFNSQKIFLTHGNQNSNSPDSSGNYVVWVTVVNGAGQIFIHDLVSNHTTQLTNSSTNLNPRVSLTGEAVWERWVNASTGGQDGWQIFWFNGQAVRQITSQGVSVNPDIENNIIVFSQKDDQGQWHAFRFSLDQNILEETKTGMEAKFPWLDNGKIKYQRRDGKRVFRSRRGLKPTSVPQPPTPTTPPLTTLSDGTGSISTDGTGFISTDGSVDSIITDGSVDTNTTVTPTPIPEPDTVTPDEIQAELDGTPVINPEDTQIVEPTSTPTPLPSPSAIPTSITPSQIPQSTITPTGAETLTPAVGGTGDIVPENITPTSVPASEPTVTPTPESNPTPAVDGS